jgi:AcrR family transcriptional regulator
MARIPKITNQQIIEAAREIFLQKGFTASTVEIAKLAGISEASIFKHFPTKEELFFTAMGIPETPNWIQEMESLLGKGDIKENLEYLCLEILEFHRLVIPRMMMLRSRGKPVPEMKHKLDQKMSAFVQLLATFLVQEAEQGRLRSGENQTVALMLMGSLIHYVILEQINSEENIILPTAIFVQQLVDTLWHGIAPI